MRLLVTMAQSSEFLTSYPMPHLTLCSPFITCLALLPMTLPPFFPDKVSNIKSSLSPDPWSLPFPPAPFSRPLAQSTLSALCPLTQKDVLALIKGPPIKSCPFDPILAEHLKSASLLCCQVWPILSTCLSRLATFPHFWTLLYSPSYSKKLILILNLSIITNPFQILIMYENLSSLP